MEEELHGLWEKGSFKDEEPPLNIKPVKTLIVYELKRYKTRLVAKGFAQHPGVGSFETFSPVIGFDVVRTVLAIPAML